jgi:hypothetical protein
MNREQLRHVLCDERIRDSTYSLTAANFDPDEALCLRPEGNGWAVYCSERGLQTGKILFSCESDACSYVLEQLRGDPTTRVGWKSGFSASGGA